MANENLFHHLTNKRSVEDLSRILATQFIGSPASPEAMVLVSGRQTVIQKEFSIYAGGDEKLLRAVLAEQIIMMRILNGTLGT